LKVKYPRISNKSQHITYLVLKVPEMTKKYDVVGMCEGEGLRWRKIKEKDLSDAILQGPTAYCCRN
jgi:hypothetical protein